MLTRPREARANCATRFRYRLSPSCPGVVVSVSYGGMAFFCLGGRDGTSRANMPFNEGVHHATAFTSFQVRGTGAGRSRHADGARRLQLRWVRFAVDRCPVGAERLRLRALRWADRRRRRLQWGQRGFRVDGSRGRRDRQGRRQVDGPAHRSGDGPLSTRRDPPLLPELLPRSDGVRRDQRRPAEAPRPVGDLRHPRRHDRQQRDRHRRRGRLVRHARRRQPVPRFDRAGARRDRPDEHQGPGRREARRVGAGGPRRRQRPLRGERGLRLELWLGARRRRRRGIAGGARDRRERRVERSERHRLVGELRGRQGQAGRLADVLWLRRRVQRHAQRDHARASGRPRRGRGLRPADEDRPRVPGHLGSRRQDRPARHVAGRRRRRHERRRRRPMEPRLRRRQDRARHRLRERPVRLRWDERRVRPRHGRLLEPRRPGARQRALDPGDGVERDRSIRLGADVPLAELRQLRRHDDAAPGL